MGVPRWLAATCIFTHCLTGFWHAWIQSYDALTNKSQTKHHTGRILYVQAQITIFQSTSANMPARHTHLEKKNRSFQVVSK